MIKINIINQYPIQIVFGIKQLGREIQDLIKDDINLWKGNMYWNPNSLEGDDINFYLELQMYKSFYKNYSGN